jgi:DNA-binding MarR family transcriptional regulator
VKSDEVGQSEQASSTAVADLREASISQLIARSYRLDRAVLEALLAELELSAAQWGLLQRVHDNPDMVGIELARLMWVTPQAVQALLSQLEKRGFIVRIAVGGGRSLRTRITAEGAALLRLTQPSVERFQRSTEATLSAVELEQFRSMLERYVRNAEDLLAEG